MRVRPTVDESAPPPSAEPSAKVANQVVPIFYRSSDEFVAAAQAAMSRTGPRQPVAVLVAESDPIADPAANGRTASSEGAVADIARHMLRADDHIGSIDGKLVMILPGATSEDGRSVAERVCAAVRNHGFGLGLRHLTLSVGAAAGPEHGNSLDVVLKAARASLARVQAQGGDGALAAPLPHHEALQRPLSIDRFVGHVDEWGSLVRWLDEACSGQPRVVSVFGEAGTGTAMILRQLEAEVRLRGGVFALGVSPNLSVRPPYGVWSGVLRATHRFPSAPKRQWHELHHLEPSLCSANTGGPPTGSQFRLLGELTDYVRAIAEDRPLVIVLDEMQFADTTSWDAVEHLLSHLDTDRLLICLAHRRDSAYDASPHREMLSHHDIAREIVLSRLTRDEVKQWLEAAFHRQQVGREFLAFLYRHTEGNPLFIAQTLRALIEEGAIWHNGTRWEWSPVSELRLPAGRRELISQRLGRFSSSTQAVLSTAAIIGHEFDVGLLVAAGAGSEPAVRLAISEAVTAGLLRATYERRHGGYQFAHEEFAEVLIDAIPNDRERQLHARVALALERRHPDRAGEIALHFDAAGETVDAYRAAQTASAMANRVHAHGAAGHYLQIAGRNATTPAELAEIRVALAHVAETGGRFDEVEELCELAIEWFDGQSDERRALTLRRMRERARMELDQPAAKTLETLLVLDAEAKRLGFDSERVAILLATSQTHGRLGDQRTAERIASEGVTMAESIGDSSLLTDALIRHGNTMLTEAPGQAHAIYSRALALSEDNGDARRQALVLTNLGIAAQFESRLDEAIDAYGRAIAVARSGGMPDRWGLAALNLGVLSQRCGDYDRARELFAEALALFAAVKHSAYQLAALFNMGHLDRELGLWDSAAEVYEATIPLAQRIGQAEIEIGATAGAGLCAIDLGRIDEARAAMKLIQERIDQRPDWFQGREIAEALFVRLAVLDGRPIEGFSRLTSALALAETSDLYSAAWLTAVCAESLGEFDRDAIRASVRRYSERVRKLGYDEMTRRYDLLARR